MWWWVYGGNLYICFEVVCGYGLEILAIGDYMSLFKTSRLKKQQLMIKEKLKKIFSFNGIALIIGIVGSLAGYFTILITEWNSQISVKWVVFTIYISFTIILILFKLVIDLNTELKVKLPNTTTVFRYVPESTTFLVYKNDFLGHLAMVSIFYLDNSFEVELGKGYVKNIQDKFIQIEIIEISDSFSLNHSDVLEKINSNNVIELQKIIIKSYVTYTNYTL